MSYFERENELLKAQLADAHELLQKENRQKIEAQSLARNVQSELAELQSKFDKLELEHFALRAEVGDQNRESETRAEQPMEPKRKKPKKNEESSDFKSKYAVYRIMKANKNHIYFGKTTTFGVHEVREIIHCEEALRVWKIRGGGNRTSKHDIIEEALKDDGVCFARLAFENEEDAYYAEYCLIESVEGTNRAPGILREKFRGTSLEQIAEDGKYYLEKFGELTANNELPIYTQHTYRSYKPEIMLEQCSKCKHFEPLCGNGMCRSCNNMSKNSENTGFCTNPNCPHKGEEIVFSSKNSTICRTCYQRNYHSESKGKCSECGSSSNQIRNKKFMICSGCHKKWLKENPDKVQKQKKRKQ
ncbi:hypothetical protein M3Y97_00515900 [Aphelenchoides bicaudatus]|nr:hypothetical protein M3Y97_00515900 [Aphelenchoides bicaudatus]